MYYFVLAIFVAVFLFIRRIVHSPFGQVLKAIRENEPRAISLGYEVDRYKLLAFVLSATLAGLAGSLKALVLGFATLSDVQQATSGEVILMTLLGGTGTFFGPVVGAAVVATLQQYLSDLVGGWVIGDHRRDLRRLRADLPPRHRRRAGRLALAAPDATAALKRSFQRASATTLAIGVSSSASARASGKESFTRLLSTDPGGVSMNSRQPSS